jgi:hypothetical protein
MRRNGEAEVAQHLRPEPVSQSHILEPDHAPRSDLRSGRPIPPVIRPVLAGLCDFLQDRSGPASAARPSSHTAGMVSEALTVAC